MYIYTVDDTDLQYNVFIDNKKDTKILVGIQYRDDWGYGDMYTVQQYIHILQLDILKTYTISLGDIRE